MLRFALEWNSDSICLRLYLYYVSVSLEPSLSLVGLSFPLTALADLSFWLPSIRDCIYVCSIGRIIGRMVASFPALSTVLLHPPQGQVYCNRARKNQGREEGNWKGVVSILSLAY